MYCISPEVFSFIVAARSVEWPVEITMSSLREVVNDLPERVDPLRYGGVVDGEYRTEAQAMSGTYLTGTSFYASCTIPDVQQNTKIIGLCGIADHPISPNNPVGYASPKQDGWFLSDFYMMHHLFKNVASDQVWITCTDPTLLVEKYGEYIHGNSSQAAEPRRVVLDRDMLAQVGDVRVVTPGVMLERALSTIREAARISRETDRPLLIMIFTHGNTTFGLQMGGINPANPQFLTIDRFKVAIGSRPFTSGICLLTSACYGGGWAINPDINVTAMTAAPYWEQSLSWPVSATINHRYCGSSYISGIIKTLMRMTVRDNDTEEQDDFDKSPTYAGLTKVLQDQIVRLDPRLTMEAGNTCITYPMFSAQDDLWETEHSQRIGISLDSFRQRWSELRTTDHRPSSPGGDSQSRSGECHFTQSQMLLIIKRKGAEYMSSHPGLDERASNTGFHNAMRGVLERGEQPDISMLEYLEIQLDYRMNAIMGAATVYKDYLGANFLDCHQADMEEYKRSRPQSWVNTLMLVRKYSLFDPPVYPETPYPKGEEYLAAVITEAGWTTSQATEKLDSLVQYRGKCASTSPNPH